MSNRSLGPEDAINDVVNRSKELPLWQQKVINDLNLELIRELDKEKKTLRILFDREKKIANLQNRLQVIEQELIDNQRASTIKYGALAREAKKYKDSLAEYLDRIKSLDSKNVSLEQRTAKLEILKSENVESERNLSQIRKEYYLLEQRYNALSGSKLGRIQKKYWQFSNNTKGTKK
ncbi:hypothetical protein [Glutamicibacter sp. AOP33-2CA-4]|uniref:hypothetical protein n=1 Tax=Glutamicibacter sp. AOP33-2CA-4 TaxID=3457690 RepID=UPI0040332BB8